MAADPVRASVLIAAPPEVVFEYFTNPDEMVLWMGQAARLDASPGGEFAVDVNGAAVRGRYVHVEPPSRLVFTWGFAGSDVLPPGSSTVEVLLHAEGGATRVEIVHRGLPAIEAESHAVGWPRFQQRLATTAAAHAQTGQTSSLLCNGHDAACECA